MPTRSAPECVATSDAVRSNDAVEGFQQPSSDYHTPRPHGREVKEYDSPASTPKLEFRGMDILPPFALPDNACVDPCSLDQHCLAVNVEENFALQGDAALAVLVGEFAD